MIQRAYKREQLAPQTRTGMARTVSNYVFTYIKKKPGSFCIGVFTVFLVVCFITALKSLVDVLPYAMLKVSQNQAGAIDFNLVSNYG
mmetsp:Transcript_29437/g.44578  ORF Transcript_29437/g.44578 Transcript_29437/m.44578 type:complete len:87 (+) Transcript_29437:343-603(+)